MNLKASRLNRCALTEGAEWYFTVTSFGHLRDKQHFIKHDWLKLLCFVSCSAANAIFYKGPQDEKDAFSLVRAVVVCKEERYNDGDVTFHICFSFLQIN